MIPYLCFQLSYFKVLISLFFNLHSFLLCCHLGVNRKLDLPSYAMDAASARDFELKGYRFDATQEQLRPPRRIRVGLIQHHIVLPSDAPILDQVQIRSSSD